MCKLQRVEKEEKGYITILTQEFKNCEGSKNIIYTAPSFATVYLHCRWFISGLGEWKIVLDRCHTQAH